MLQHRYHVQGALGQACKAAGLSVQFVGDVESIVVTNNSQEYETYWAKRLEFLRANSQAD